MCAIQVEFSNQKFKLYIHFQILSYDTKFLIIYNAISKDIMWYMYQIIQCNNVIKYKKIISFSIQNLLLRLNIEVRQVQESYKQV